MNNNGMRKPNRRAQQDEKGRVKRPMLQSGRSLKQTLPRHINQQPKRLHIKKRS